MSEYQLYHTLACHLCEDAEAIIQALLTDGQPSVTKVDIADDDALIEAYGVRIPVFRHRSSGDELAWPFTSHQCQAFIAAHA